MKKTEFYKSRAWFYFSRYILLKFMNKDFVCRCSTCNNFYSVNDKKLHVGHLIKVFDGNSSNFSVCFDERNVGPQCYKCNVKKGGNELKMLDFIEDLHGKGTYENLKQKSRIPYYGFSKDISSIKDYYHAKFNELKKIKGDPWKR